MRWILFIVIGGPLLLLLLTVWWLVCLISLSAIIIVMLCEAANEGRKRHLRVDAARGQVIRGPRS